VDLSFNIFPSLGNFSRNYSKNENLAYSFKIFFIGTLFSCYGYTFFGDSVSGFLGFLGFLFYNSRWIMDFALGFSAPLNSSAST
jgi:hypothetical protein